MFGRTIAVLAVWVALLPALAHGQDAGGNLARMWVVVPKAGMEDQLEAAMKAHNAWRIENGDPWGWNTYHRVSGGGLNEWYLRSRGHSYADFDRYRDSAFSKKAFDHWSANVDQYVAEYRTHISEYAPEISHEQPYEGTYEYYWVYEYYIKPGMGRAFYVAAKAISQALKDANWPETWWFNWHLDGERMPVMSLVIPSANWAGFGEPAETAYDTLAGAMGEARAKTMWDALYTTVESVSSAVYHRHVELSYEGAGD